MALGKRRPRQATLWVEASRIEVRGQHPFYRRLNQILEEARFDHYVERLCAKYYAGNVGRPSIAPGVYFRCFLIGYFEGIGSERGIAYRVSDSLSLREFLGLGLEEATPDHSTLSKTRRLLSLGTHQAVFRWVLKRLVGEGLLRGKMLGIDATTLEANAAMRSIVRRDDGRSYQEYVAELMHHEGQEAPTAVERQRWDRRRAKRVSNREWVNPHDPEARITKLKDGRTRLAYKAEHAVDLETGAVVAVTVQPGDRGDGQSLVETLGEAGETVAELALEAAEAGEPSGVNVMGVEGVVADKGYHSREGLKALAELEVRTWVAEPERGRQRWRGDRAAQAAVYANRRRLRSERGRGWMRRRGELLERSFAHLYDTAGLRRSPLRGKENLAKRLLIHAAAFNLSLILRRELGVGTARQATERAARLFWLLLRLCGLLRTAFWSTRTPSQRLPKPIAPRRCCQHSRPIDAPLSTG